MFVIPDRSYSDFIRATRKIAAVIFRANWSRLVFLLAISFAIGAMASSFAEFISDMLNARVSSVGGLFEGTIGRGERDAWLSRVMSRSEVLGTFAGTAVICILLALLMAGGTYWSERITNHLRAMLYEQFRREAFELSMDDGEAALELIRAAGSGEANTSVSIANAINRGAESVSGVYTYIIGSLKNIITILTALATTGLKTVPIAVVCVMVVLVQVMIARRQAKKLVSTRKFFDAVSNDLQGQTAGILDSRELISSFDKTSYYKGKVLSLVSEVASTGRKNSDSESYYSSLQDLTQKWGQIAVIVFCFLLVSIFSIDPIGGDRPLVFALTLYGSLLPSARNLIEAYDSMKRSESMVGSFLLLLNSEVRIKVNAGERRWLVGQEISFENVTYQYPSSEVSTVDALYLTIPAGKTTLILGPSGCGKTTIGKILLGFIKPQSGDIKMGGREIKEWSQSFLHEQMSYGPQNDHILDETVEDNLRLAENSSESFTREQLLDVLAKVRLGGAGGENLLHRRAKKLSGGQIQRLSAARIMLDNSEIVVLDEPMAGIDVFTMADIAPEIESHWNATRQTVVIISHKLIFAGLASKVVILGEDGKVIEEGDPRVLSSEDSIYRKLRDEALRQIGA